MVTVAIVLGYLLTAVLFILSLKSVNFKALEFIDGALIGAGYYIMIPLGIIIIEGGLSVPTMRAPPFVPDEDIMTTLNIFVGICTVIGVHWLVKRSKAPDDDRVAFSMSSFYIMAAAYLALSIAMFVISGKQAGGHWQKNLETAFGQSTSAILIGNFANAYRTAIFGALLFLFERGHIDKLKFIAFGFLIVVADLAISFNRITAAYFAISCFIAFRRYFFALVGGVVVASPAIGYLTSFWAVFRAMALMDGMTLTSAMKAFDVTSRYMGSVENDIDNVLNGTFEAGNLLVLNYIVNSVPERFSPLWGSTFVVRPLTVFLPSTIWADKPGVFGLLMGKQIQGLNGLALNSTLFGEAYANFYFAWPLALGCALFLVNLLYRQIARFSPVYGYCGCMIAIATWRFDMSFPVIAFVSLVVFESIRRVARR